MAYYIITILLFIGGVVGWSLFFYSVYQTIISRKKEVQLISEIKSELNLVKQELVDIKKNR